MDEASSRTRMRWLVAAHMVLAVSPAFQFVFFTDGRLFVLSWVCISLPFGGAMALSVWLGLGRARIGWRLLTSIVAVAYLSLWMAVGNVLAFSSPSEYVHVYLESLIPYGTVVILFGGMFLLLGRFYKISRDELPIEMHQPEGIRFSVLHVLMLMSLVAVIFTLLHSVRASDSDEASSVLGWRATDSLGLLVFFLNTGCAAYAALWPRNVGRNIGLVLIVSVLLGIVLAFATRNDQSAWWLFVGSMFIGIVPTVVEIVSLLVVRSCGYRFVRRTREVPAAEG